MDITKTKEAQELNALFEELVPDSGMADTAAGEIVRAASRIGYRYTNDGDKLGEDYGNHTVNAAARYLMAQDFGLRYIINTVWDGDNIYNITPDDEYERFLLRLVGAVVEHIANHPELKTTPNTTDMFSFCRKSDEDYDNMNWDEDDDY